MIKSLSGKAVAGWLAGFFVIVIAMNAYFIAVSVKTFRGEDEQKPYLQGVAYNDTLARRAAQQALGLSATIGAVRQADGKLRIDLRIRQADGSAVAGLALSGELRHPSDETRDKPLRLDQMEPGRYVGLLSGVGTGMWDISVSSRDAHLPFEAARRVWVP